MNIASTPTFTFKTSIDTLRMYRNMAASVAMKEVFCILALLPLAESSAPPNASHLAAALVDVAHMVEPEAVQRLLLTFLQSEL